MSDEEIFSMLWEEMSQASQNFYSSLKGSPYFEHYKNLLVRYATHRAFAVDLIRIAAFDIHYLAFTLRRKVREVLGTSTTNIGAADRN